MALKSIRKRRYNLFGLVLMQLIHQRGGEKKNGSLMKAKQDGAQKKAHATDPIHADESRGCSQHPRAELFCLLLAHKYSKWGRNAVKMVR